MPTTSEQQNSAILQHEMRQPLHAIEQLCALLNQSDLTTKQQQWIAQISRMQQTLTDLLSEAQTRPFALEAVVEQLQTIFHSKAIKKQLTFSIQVASDTATHWEGQSTFLLQILINLIDNAIKYTPSGGKIELKIKEKDGLAIKLKDNGLGIDSVFQEKMKMPYVQLQNDVEGVGLGWHIVRQKMEALNGSYTLKSEPGKGTCIYLHFPFQQATAYTEVSIQPNFSARLLIVEDHTLHRDHLQRLLASHWTNLEVTTAKNSEEALAMLQRQPMDCVLTDIHLPSGSGLELAQRIRCELGLQIPLLAMSADDQNVFARQEAAVYFQTYLQKPFRVETLVRQLTSYINSSPMHELSITPQHINLSYLLLMADEDADMKKLMLAMLLDEIPTELEKMNDCYERKDWDMLRRISHKMKTTLSFVGNEKLTKTNDEIERLLKQKAIDERITTAIRELNETMPKILEELKMVYEAS